MHVCMLNLGSPDLKASALTTGPHCIDITPTVQPISLKRFTVLKGNGKSILGIKNDSTVTDDSLDGELDECFKLPPSELEK